jgi:hypothetical protein
MQEKNARNYMPSGYHLFKSYDKIPSLIIHQILFFLIFFSAFYLIFNYIYGEDIVSIASWRTHAQNNVLWFIIEFICVSIFILKYYKFHEYIHGFVGIRYGLIPEYGKDTIGSVHVHFTRTYGKLTVNQAFFVKFAPFCVFFLVGILIIFFFPMLTIWVLIILSAHSISCIYDFWMIYHIFNAIYHFRSLPKTSILIGDGQAGSGIYIKKSKK